MSDSWVKRLEEKLVNLQVKNNFKSVKKSELASQDPTIQEEKIRREEEKVKDILAKIPYNSRWRIRVD